MLSSIYITVFYAYDLIKSHGFVQVVRIWCGLHANPVPGYLNDPEG
jgi:hypothetical protein